MATIRAPIPRVCPAGLSRPKMFSELAGIISSSQRIAFSAVLGSTRVGASQRATFEELLRKHKMLDPDEKLTGDCVEVILDQICGKT